MFRRLMNPLATRRSRCVPRLAVLGMCAVAVSCGTAGNPEEGTPMNDSRRPTNRTVVQPVAPAIEFFVAPSGSDDNHGGADKPFATLERARAAVREEKIEGLPAGGIAVTLRPGEYLRTATLQLTTEDGGAPGAPVVYRAEQPGTAVLYGGARLSAFVVEQDPAVLRRLPEEARGKVYRCDLKALGVTDYGFLAVRGFGQPPSPPTVELFFDGEPMTLARWPNEGFVEAGRLVDGGEKGRRPSVFEYAFDRHERWVAAEDAWLFGYFKWLWADATVKVGRIDPERRTITTAEAYDYGGGMSATQGIIYYAFNLLEELDAPGEWYLDRSNGVLYLWPPSDPARASIEIGMLASPMVTVDGAEHLRIEGLTFDLGRHDCMTVRRSRHCLVVGCTVRRFAGSGITIAGGSDCGILGCDVGVIGRRGTEVIGGDRRTLAPGNHFVENCRIHDFGRIDRTYTPAVQLEGVGNRVSRNLFYNCPSSVMRIEGNDHRIEYNETHSAVRESDDQGAMELFYNPTYRGIVFRYNLFYDVGKTGTEKAVHGQAAIRLDDAISGVLVYGNVFVRCANGNFGAVQINSGRDNLIENNLFIDCRQGVSGGWSPGNAAWRSVREGTHRPDFFINDLYRDRYPEIATMIEEHGSNTVRKNVFFRSGPVAVRTMGRMVLLDNREYPDVDPEFEPGRMDRFPSEAAARLLAEALFGTIRYDEIGLYDHPLRASPPALPPRKP